MSVIHMDFLSRALGMFTSVNLILPLPRQADAPLAPLPVLYLLHGMGDDDSAWLYKSCVERLALMTGLAVVMPDGNLSCYENMVHREKYRDYVAHELPEKMQETFPLSKKREENFIAGCSMGGFGALKLGFAYPEKWCAVGVFSAAHMEYQPNHPRNQSMLKRVYGDNLAAYDAQIQADILHVNENGPHLRLWHGWGDQDVLKENALKTQKFFHELPGGHVRYQGTEFHGRHDWALWDEMLARFVPWLNLNPKGVRFS